MLVTQVANAIGDYRAGKLDVHGVDRALHQYHLAARELWKFCWAGGGRADIEFVADLIDEQEAAGRTTDWWTRGAPRPH
jgi:hypothetical protein